MKYLLSFAFALVFPILSFSQTSGQEMKNLKDLPMYVVDSIPVQNADLTRLNPDDVANMSILQGDKALHYPGNTLKKKKIIFIETKKFAKKRYWNYLKSKSDEYGKIVSSPDNDQFVQYIINGIPSKSDVLLSGINDRNFISLKVIPKDSLLKKYGIYRKNYGVEIQLAGIDSLKRQ